MGESNFFLIIGLGSIGKRHLNNLMNLGIKNIIIVSKSIVLPHEFSCFLNYQDLQKAILENNISHAFVCTPTSNHLQDLKILLKNNIENVYLEKPVSHNLEELENIKPLLNNCKRLVVGFDLHFDPGLNKIRTILNDKKLGKIFSINAVVGQYLPDWRPDQDHRLGMSAKIIQGGGVMLDLIHEFDYLRWLVGIPKKIACVYQKNSILEIETEDVADVLIHFNHGQSGTIHLDYHQKKLVRNCMITCENGTIFWDLVQSEVRMEQHREEKVTFNYHGFDRNQRYIEILKCFLNETHWDERLTTFEDALISLKMVVLAKIASEQEAFLTFD